MRILRIRGKNLASLADDFDVDLMASPLGGCGVFALSGPTGAGKSTILDALCLALYATTPRLERALRVQMPDPSGQTIPSDNAAQLLRRGAGNGFAEAEFVGNDGRAYRARLTLRRANGRANGKVQPLIHELFTKDDAKPCGGTASETQALIVEKLGLDVRQFTRAVLLAQNEFSAFLVSNADDRATLLETLTGTERFGELSTRVFQRAKQERERLALLEAELAATPVLGDAERGALEERIGTLTERLQTTERQVTAIAAQLEHERRERESERAVVTAEQEFARCQQRIEALAPERLELRRLRRAMFEAKDLVEAMRQAEGERLGLQRRSSENQRRVEQAKTDLIGLREREQAASSGLAQVEAQEATIRPMLLRAALVDQELVQRDDRLEEQRKALFVARQTHEQAEGTLAGTRARLDELDRQIDALSVWLGEHQDLGRLSEGWASKRAALGRALERHGQLQQARARCVELERVLERDRPRLAELLADATRLADALSAATAQANTLLELARADDLDQLELGERDAEKCLLRHQELSKSWEQLAQVAAGLAVLRQRDAEERSARDQLQGEVESRRERIARLGRELQDKTSELRGAERLIGQTVESLRAVLREGEPCPVCGATDHPFGGSAAGEVTSRLRANLNSLGEHVSRLQAEFSRLQREDADAIASAAGLEERLRGNALSIQRAEAERDELAQRLQGWEEYGPIRALPSDDARATLYLRGQRLDGQLESTRQARLDAKRRRVAAEEAAERVRVSREKHAAVDEQRLRFERTLVESELGLRTVREQRQLLENDQARELEPIESWREWWDADPRACLERVDAAVAEWQAQSARITTLGGERNQVHARLPDLERSALATAAAVSESEARVTQAEGVVEEKRQERRAIFEGRAIREVEAELGEMLRRATNELEQARAQRQTAEQNFAVLEAERLSMAQTQERATATFAQCELAVERWIDAARTAEPELGIERERLVEWIALAPSALPELESRLDAAQSASDQARGALEQAIAARVAQAALGEEVGRALQEALGNAPAAPLDELLGVTTHEREALRNERADAQAKLSDDQRVRMLLGMKSSERELQRSVVERWQLLAELIGSADGKKLRHLAQEVTLDLVLEHANLHLHDLARRYRLERLPHGLHIVVVDAELWGEPRSVASLSGGETFLVSLALALGLASLSAEKVRVETLFIDEGFGSLDGSTLQVAVAALDRVQAAGRQVGVVSHVGDLAERLGVEVRVEPTGGGRSRVRVIARQGSR